MLEHAEENDTEAQSGFDADFESDFESDSEFEAEFEYDLESEYDSEIDYEAELDFEIEDDEDDEESGVNETDDLLNGFVQYEPHDTFEDVGVLGNQKNLSDTDQKILDNFAQLEFDTDVALSPLIPVFEELKKTHGPIKMKIWVGFMRSLVQNGEQIDQLGRYNLPYGNLESEFLHIYHWPPHYEWSTEFSPLDLRSPSFKWVGELFEDFHNHDADDIYCKRRPYPTSGTKARSDTFFYRDDPRYPLHVYKLRQTIIHSRAKYIILWGVPAQEAMLAAFGLQPGQTVQIGGIERKIYALAHPTALQFYRTGGIIERNERALKQIVQETGARINFARLHNRNRPDAAAMQVIMQKYSHDLPALVSRIPIVSPKFDFVRTYYDMVEEDVTTTDRMEILRREKLLMAASNTPAFHTLIAEKHKLRQNTIHMSGLANSEDFQQQEQRELRSRFKQNYLINVAGGWRCHRDSPYINNARFFEACGQLVRQGMTSEQISELRYIHTLERKVRKAAEVKRSWYQNLSLAEKKVYNKKQYQLLRTKRQKLFEAMSVEEQAAYIIDRNTKYIEWERGKLAKMTPEERVAHTKVKSERSKRSQAKRWARMTDEQREALRVKKREWCRCWLRKKMANMTEEERKNYSGRRTERRRKERERDPDGFAERQKQYDQKKYRMDREKFFEANPGEREKYEQKKQAAIDKQEEDIVKKLQASIRIHEANERNFAKFTEKHGKEKGTRLWIADRVQRDKRNAKRLKKVTLSTTTRAVNWREKDAERREEADRRFAIYLASRPPLPSLPGPEEEEDLSEMSESDWEDDDEEENDDQDDDDQDEDLLEMPDSDYEDQDNGEDQEDEDGNENQEKEKDDGTDDQDVKENNVQIQDPEALPADVSNSKDKGYDVVTEVTEIQNLEIKNEDHDHDVVMEDLNISKFEIQKTEITDSENESDEEYDIVMEDSNVQELESQKDEIMDSEDDGSEVYYQVLTQGSGCIKVEDLKEEDLEMQHTIETGYPENIGYEHDAIEVDDDSEDDWDECGEIDVDDPADDDYVDDDSNDEDYED